MLAPLLLACASPVIDRQAESADSGADSAPTGDSGRGEVDPDCGHIEWLIDRLCLCFLGDPGDVYFLGMAETGSTDGWYGEDCLPGDEASPGYDLCHDGFVANVEFCLATVSDPDDVVPMETTVFTHTNAWSDDISYVIGDAATGMCLAFGNDSSWYRALACTEV
jgi:hypothetical protein